MLPKVKSLLTSAHCEEWDNKTQNESRAQALFPCLSQALSKEKIPSLRKLLIRFWVLFMQRTWSWACEEDAVLIHCGNRAKPGTFLPHCASPWCVMFFVAEYVVWNMPWAQRHAVHFLVQSTASSWLCRIPERSARFVTAGDKWTEHPEVTHFWRFYRNNSPNMPVLKPQLAPLLFRLSKSLLPLEYKVFLTPCTIPLRFYIAIRQGWTVNFQ